MKKLLTILFLFLAFIASSQDPYYRYIDWKFIPDSIVVVGVDTFLFKAEPFDFNEPGSISRTVGNYVVDFVGHRYKVIDSTATTLTVFDEFATGQAPQTDQVARCYRSVGSGDADYIGSVDYSSIDESARWKLNGSDNELLWRAATDTLEYLKPIKATTNINANDSVLATLGHLNLVKDTLNTRIDSVITTIVLSGIRDTLQFHADSLIIAFDSIAVHLDSLQSHNIRILINKDSLIAHNLRLLELEGYDTIGVYHWNRALLDKIGSDDTLRWNEFSEWDKDYQDLINKPSFRDSVLAYQSDLTGILDTLQFHRDSLIIAFDSIVALRGDITANELTKATNIEALTGLDAVKFMTPETNRFVNALINLPYEGALQDLNMPGFNITAKKINSDSVFIEDIDIITTINNKVADEIIDGVTTISPSENIVHDSLAVKLPINNPTATGILTTPDLKLTGVGFNNAGYVLKTNLDGSVYAGALTASQVYKGKWDASTNTPTLANGTGTAGWYYRVVVDGTVDLGGGSIAFITGDDVYYNGTVWERIPAPEILGNELSKVDDTNVTLTLGGSPLTSLLNAASLTLGWIGTLADGRIASSTFWNTAYSHSQLITGNPHSVTATNVGLGNVENAAASGLYKPIGYIPTWSEITSNPFIFTTPTTGQLSRFNGTNWVNWTPTYISSFTETDPIFGAHTTYNIFNGTGFLKNNGTGTWTYDNSTYLVAADITGKKDKSDSTLATGYGTNYKLGLKQNLITVGTTLQYYRGDKTFQTLNTSIVPELTNLYYTEARVAANSAVALNTAKVTNVPTALSTGTVTATTYGITSDGSANDIILPEANTTQAGLLGADKWDEIVSNTAKVGYTNTLARGSLSLTTTGSSGASTYSSATGVFNIPTYTLSGLGYTLPTFTIDSVGRVFRLTLGGTTTIKFLDTNTTYDLSGYKLKSDSTAADGYTRRDRLTSSLLTKENAFSKNTAFNKNFGTTVTTVAYGNHLHSGVYEVPLTFSTGLLRTGNTITNTITQFTNAMETDKVYVADSTKIKADILVNYKKKATLIESITGLNDSAFASVADVMNTIILMQRDTGNLEGLRTFVETYSINTPTDISGKVDKVAGKALSDNNFTDADSTKLLGIAVGAEVNVQSDWSAVSGDALILNKPTIPSGNQIIDWTTASQGTIHATNYVDNVNDADFSITNEIQNLSLVGNTLSLSSDATTVDLSGYVNPNISQKQDDSDTITFDATAYDLAVGLATKENTFSKNTAFNKNFGTTVTTVAYGNHLHSGVYEVPLTFSGGLSRVGNTITSATTPVYNETPSGLINGSNTTYTTASPFVTNSTQVYLNGVRETLGVHYTESGSTIIFGASYILQTGDILRIDYEH